MRRAAVGQRADLRAQRHPARQVAELSAKATNQMLAASGGFSSRNDRDEWELTEAGEAWAEAMPCLAQRPQRLPDSLESRRRRRAEGGRVMSLPIISAQQRWPSARAPGRLMLGKSGIGKTTRLKDLDPEDHAVPRHRGGRSGRGRLAGRHHPSGDRGRNRAIFVFLAGPTVAAAGVRVLAGALRPRHRSLAIRRNSTATRPSSSTRSRSCRASAFAWCKTQPGRSATEPASPTWAALTVCSAGDGQRLTHLQHARARTWCSSPSSTNASMTTTARCSSRRSRAARPA